MRVLIPGLLILILVSSVSGYTLDDYPDVFLNGKFNGVIVTGETASGSDVLGAIGISTHLQSYLSQKQYEQIQAVLDAQAEGPQLQGDIVRIGFGSDLLEIGETIGEVKETITEFDVEALRGGRINTRRGSTDYNQYIRFEETGISSGRIVFDRDEDGEVGDFLLFEDGDVMFEYEIEFARGLESEIESGSGDLKDLEDETILLMGWPYTFVDTDVNTGSGRIKLRLLGGPASDMLMEGTRKTYTIDGREYTVEVLIVCDSCANGEGSVKFRVNDYTTDELEDGETDLLPSGMLIGVKSIFPNEAGEIYGFEPTTIEEAEAAQFVGGDLVEFFLGATRLEFTDRYTDDAFERGVEVYGENIEDATVKILASVRGNEFELSSIKYRLAADSPKGDVYIKPGQGLRQFLDEPEGLLVPNWDIRYEGLDDTGIAIIRFDARGDDSYELHFTNNQGVDYQVPLVDNTGGFKLGDDDEDLLFIECASPATFCIEKGDYAVLTDDNDETGITNVIQFKGTSASQKQITVREVGTGNKESTYIGTEGVDAEGKLVLGGNTYIFFVGPGPDYDISLDFTNDGSISSDEANIVTQGGGIIDLGTTNTPGGTFSVTLTTLNSEFDENGPLDAGGDEVITIDIEDRAGGEVGLGFPSQPFLDFQSLKGVNLDQALTPYGVFFETDIDTNDAEDLVIEYPRTQRGGQVYVTFGPVEPLYVEELPSLTQIELGTAVLDTEIYEAPTPHMIVIGGPCANKVAAKLLDFPEPCTAGFEPGIGHIRGFNLGDKFAILVAGYDAMDTRRASAVLAEYNKYPLFGGNTLEITGSLENPIVRRVG